MESYSSFCVWLISLSVRFIHGVACIRNSAFLWPCHLPSYVRTTSYWFPRHLWSLGWLPAFSHRGYRCESCGRWCTDVCRNPAFRPFGTVVLESGVADPTGGPCGLARDAALTGAAAAAHGGPAFSRPRRRLLTRVCVYFNRRSEGCGLACHRGCHVLVSLAARDVERLFLCVWPAACLLWRNF